MTAATHKESLTVERMACELWAAAQLAPGEGIEDGCGRIERIVSLIMADEREKWAPLGGKYAEVLVPFVALMERELHANSSKGDRPGWLTMSREVALLEIYWHAAKLSAAVKNNEAALIREHAADVANMAMMALDVCGHLLPAGSESAGRSEGGA